MLRVVPGKRVVEHLGIYQMTFAGASRYVGCEPEIVLPWAQLACAVGEIHADDSILTLDAMGAQQRLGCILQVEAQVVRRLIEPHPEDVLQCRSALEIEGNPLELSRVGGIVHLHHHIEDWGILISDARGIGSRHHLRPYGSRGRERRAESQND